jgi:hypothetical protein
MHEITLGEVDTDGAVGGTLAALVGSTRAELLRDAAVGATAVLLAGGAPARASKRTHQAIMNFAITH